MKAELSEIVKPLKDFVQEIAEETFEAKMEYFKQQVLFNNQEFLTVNDVCKMTGLSRSTIYTYVNEKKIPYYKPTGKNLFFKPEDIKNFIMDERNYYKSKEMLLKEAETIYMLDRI